MTVPVVDALARQYPDLRITVLSRAVARPLFDRLPSNVSFMEADVRKEYHGVKGLNALYRRLAAKHFTAVADFHNVLRSNYLRMRFNIDHYRVAHINKHRNGRKRLTAVSDKLLVQQPTSFRNYMDVLEKLGYPVKPDFKTIFAEGGNDLSLLPDTFNVQREPRQRWIGIAPFAAHEGKIYPLRLMERVIVLLGERFPSCRLGSTGQPVARTGADEPPRRDVVDGQCQHAPGIDRGHARGEYMGCHTSLCRIHGLGAAAGERRAARPALPPVQHLWQQTLPARRLLVPEEHFARPGSGPQCGDKEMNTIYY